MLGRFLQALVEILILVAVKACVGRGFRDHGFSMKLAGILFASIVLFLSPLMAEKSERVLGAAAIDATEDLESVLFHVVGEPLGQEEIELLLKEGDAILAWARDNSEQWLSADDAENPLKVIRNFPVWKTVGISSSEFVAIVSKIMFYNEYSQAGIDIDNLNLEKSQMESFLESPDLPAEAKPEVLAMIQQVNEMIHIVENVLPKSVPVFTKNKREIDAFISSMQSIEDSL